jgi:hypothetical protein
LSQLKETARRLSIEQLRRLDTWLHEHILEVEATKRASTGGAVTKKRSVGHVTYRQEGIRCGKENCKCAAGDLHGPYWYAYWLEGGKTRSKYVGKKLPDQALKKADKGKRR